MRHHVKCGTLPVMSGTTAKRLHTLIALLLLVCIASPFFELAVHSDGSIFASGHDGESTLALLLLVVELSFAVGKLIAIFLPQIPRDLGLARRNPLPSPDLSLALLVAEHSPPLPLRI